jgi:hypothetical protein
MKFNKKKESKPKEEVEHKEEVIKTEESLRGHLAAVIPSLTNLNIKRIIIGLLVSCAV